VRWWPAFLLNIMRSRKSSARDTFRSSLHSTHTSKSLTEAALPHWTAASFLIVSAQERAVRGTHLGLSCTQPAPQPRYQNLGELPHIQPIHYNIVRSRTSSARDIFRSLLHSTRTSTSQHEGHDKKLYGDGLPFLILSDHERAVRGSQLGPSCTHREHIPVRTVATLPNCTAAALTF